MVSNIVNLNDVAFERKLRENAKLLEENKSLRAEIARLMADRPYIVGFNDGYQAVQDPLPDSAENPL